VEHRVSNRSTNENTTRDGRTVVCDWFNTPLIDSSGKVIGVTSLVMDITAQTRTEETLRESEERFRTIVDMAPDAILITSRAGGILEANSAACAQLGLTRAQLLERSVFDIVPSRFRGQVEENLEATEDFFEVCHLRADGTEIPVEVNFRGVLLDGQPVILCIARDITERKRAEKTVAWLASFPERSAIPTAEIEYPAGEVRYAIPAARRLFPDLLRRGFSHPWLAGLEEMAATLFEEHNNGEIVREVLVEGHWYAQSVYSITDRQQQLIRASAVDITERKSIEEALYESESRFRTLAESSLVGLYILQDDKYVYVNPAMARVFGYSAAEMTGMTPHDIVHPTHHAMVDQNIRSRITGEVQSLRYEVRGKYRDGSIRDVEVFGSTVLLKGRPALIGTLLDITDRKRAEENVSRRNVLIETLLEHAPIGFAINSITDGKVQFLSQKFVNIYGLEADAIRNVDDFFERAFQDPVLRETLRQRIVTDMASGEISRMRWEDVEFTTRAGERRVVNAANIPLPEQDLMISMVQDVTERKLMEAQFHQAQKMESIGRLAGGVAHDFNNLLTVINGYSQLLLKGLKADDPLRHGLDQIYKAGERAAGLTRQLLAFSRKQILELRQLDFNRVVKDMHPMLERMMGEDIDVQVALHAERSMVRADLHQLEQVVMNLVVNARDAMPGVGKLLIETSNVERDQGYAEAHAGARVGSFVMLTVSDTGAGMDEETKKKIFEPFFTTKEVGKGTGLGLSMVQGVVAQSGGHIEVDSQKGKGTSFRIFLPALEEAVAASFSSATVPVLGGRESVLVVEDEPEVRKYAVAVLKGYGYRVIAAANPGEALLVCESERVDLVLTDVVMPFLGGRELANRLETLQPGIKVLFMSGYTDDAIVHRGVQDESARFIQKPFTPEELARRVRSVLESPVDELRHP